MLERLTLRNFQRWRKLELELARVTVLVGKTGSGKSAALRALRWLAFNRPTGDAYIRHGAKWARASLTLDDRHIDRVKGDGKNLYRLDGENYKAFGAGVPQEISTLLGMDEAVNYAGQHAPPYWLSAAPGEVARALNAVVDLKLIDEVLAAAARDVRQTQAEEGVARQRLKAAKEKVKELAWVPKANRAWEGVQESLLRADVARQQEERLRSLLEQIEGIGEPPPRTFWERGDRVLVLARQAEEAGTKAHRLERLLAEVERLEEERCRATDSLTQLEAERQKLLSKACPVCGRPVKMKSS